MRMTVDAPEGGRPRNLNSPGHPKIGAARSRSSQVRWMDMSDTAPALVGDERQACIFRRVSSFGGDFRPLSQV